MFDGAVIHQFEGVDVARLDILCDAPFSETIFVHLGP